MIGIAIGGFLGAITRYLVYMFIESRARKPKIATWLVNGIGSFVLGLLIGNGSLSVFWMTGFLGAFTTFSTLALDVVKDIEDGKWKVAVFYVTATLTTGIALFSFGYILMH